MVYLSGRSNPCAIHNRYDATRWPAYIRDIRSLLPSHWNILFRHDAVDICGTRELDEWLKSITPDMTLPVKLTVQRVDSEVWPSLKLVLAKLPRSFGHWGEYNLIELFNPGDDLDRASSSEAIRWLGEFAGQANRITLHDWTFRVDEMAAMALAVEDGHWITLDYSPWVSRDIEVGAWRMSDATERQCKGAKLTLRLTLALSPLAFAMDTLCNSPERRDWIHDLALSLIRAGFVPLNCSLEFNLEDCELADEDEERLLDEDQQRIEADKELFTILLCDIMTVLERTLYPPRCNPSVKSWRRLDPSERVKVNKQEGSMGDGAGMTGEKELGKLVEGTAKHGQVAVGGPENAAGTQHAGGTEGRANKE